jgi:hypothetical protein
MFFSMMSFSIPTRPTFYVSKTAKPRNRALTKCCSALSGSTGSQADLSRFQGTHFAQAAQVSLSIAEPGCQECLDKVPGDGRSHGPAAHTDNVHVIVLDSLPRREVVMDETGTNTHNLVGTNGRTDAAAADRHPALHFAGGHRSGERDDKIGVIVAGVKTVSTEIDYFMPGRTKLGNELFFQPKSTVISGNSEAHVFSLICLRC